MYFFKFFTVLIFSANLLFSGIITPIPLHVSDVNLQKAKLGKKLFSDPILSKDDTIACSNCHLLNDGGDDNLKVSFGILGKKGTRNSPTVYNARYNFVQFWDGRAKDLQSQAEGPIQNPVEMGNNFKNLIKTLKSSPYNKEFKKIYKDGVTRLNITDAIAEYEKTLITPNSAFDKYLRGDKNALTQQQKNGYNLFKSEGCIACHNGINIGGNLYSKLGFMKNAKSKDLGRYDITKNPDDKYFFKVPTLRNIAKTAPYMHDGRYSNLKDVVKFMLEYQLGNSANKRDVDDIVSFLKSLTGELPRK